MKNSILSLVLVFMLGACSSVSKFPVSNVTPAAEITAKIKKDNNNNYLISIVAINLASVERLAPPMKTYVVWLQTNNNGLKNVGQLNNKNAKKATLETLSPFEPEEIFITAENAGDLSYPEGIEISRTTVKK